jgi:5-formyltetrahydrofolate cyclo-ligase
VNPKKTSLRNELKTARLGFTKEERQIKSSAICERLLGAVDWTLVKRLHFFEPIESLGEVNINEFIAEFKRAYPNTELYVSRRAGSIWQVLELKSMKAIEQVNVDAVIVPMLGFDDHLQRIGYGGGYYDKFLSVHKALKIGVCFEQGRVHEIPAEDHDVPLDMIITEDEVYIKPTP